MESRSEKSIVRIVVTGPESTGKTNISDFLASHLNALWVPEYARFYVSSLRNKYTYRDIEHIARKQIDDYTKYTGKGKGIVIFDTWLIITKVWFDVVYGKHPDWLDKKIEQLPIDLYLLCAPDIPWESDGVRENGGKIRDMLFDRYKKEIEALHVPLQIISGSGDSRFQSALRVVMDFNSNING